MLVLFWKVTVTLLFLMAVIVREGAGLAAYHRQPELDAEKMTSLSRAVEFPTVGYSDGSSDSGEVFMASTDGEVEQDSDQG